MAWPKQNSHDTMMLSALQKGEGKIRSFEETYQTSYSHGLELIYAIEDVDLKSIRRLNDSSPEEPEKVKVAEAVIAEVPVAEDELDFGLGFQSCLEPFLWREPIQVLGLAKPLEKLLLHLKKTVLQDLYQIDLQEFVYVRGIGQGHIDEIQSKLKEYLKGKQLDPSQTLDMGSWLKTLTADFEWKKVVVFCEEYGIPELYNLQMPEKLEIRRLTPERKQDWIADVKNYLRIPAKRKQVNEDLRYITEVLLKPWIRLRGGIACISDIQEHLESLREGPVETSSVLSLFQDLYFEGECPLNTFLHSLEDEIFASDAFIADAYYLVVETSYSYFYQPEVLYTLDQLTGLVERELALHWLGFAEGFVEKVLRSSSLFRVRRSMEGTLVVKLR